MKSVQFSKFHKRLEKGRYFSTIWCALDDNILPYLQDMLKPLKPYCNWLSTYGNHKKNSKYLPHITLRYLGYTDELNKESLLSDKNKFKNALNKIMVRNISVKNISIWDKTTNNKTLVARLNWEISDKSKLIQIHKSLLDVPGYQFFEELEGNNYDPHISLGQVKLMDDNLIKVRKYLSEQKHPLKKVKLTNFAINYAKEGERKKFFLVK